MCSADENLDHRHRKVVLISVRTPGTLAVARLARSDARDIVPISARRSKTILERQKTMFRRAGLGRVGIGWAGGAERAPTAAASATLGSLEQACEEQILITASVDDKHDGIEVTVVAAGVHQP